METHQNIITKNKPYFILPIDTNSEAAIFTAFKIDQFNPKDDLKVVLRKECKDGDELEGPFSLLEFKDKYVSEKKVIRFNNDKGIPYLLITLLTGKINSKGKFIEIEKLDPDNIGDFKISVEFKYQKTLVKTY